MRWEYCTTGGEKMAINKDHPDYPGYIAKCKALADKYYHQEAREEEKS